MGTSLLSAEQKAALNAVIDDLHETFAREITVFKEASRIVIATDPSFNPIYNTVGNSDSIENTPVSMTIRARIYYNNDIEKKYFNYRGNLDSQIKLELPVGTVRIKVDQEAYDFVKDAKRFDVDGKRYFLNSVIRPHGLFDNKYYSIILDSE